MTVPPAGAPGDAKPSKAWIGLLALGIAVIMLLSTCIAGVFYDVNSRVRDAPPSPTRRMTPSPSRTGPGSPSPSVRDSPGVGGAAALGPLG